jgi:hypothetical protein
MKTIVLIIGFNVWHVIGEVVDECQWYIDYRWPSIKKKNMIG